MDRRSSGSLSCFLLYWYRHIDKSRRDLRSALVSEFLYLRDLQPAGLSILTHGRQGDLLVMKCAGTMKLRLSVREICATKSHRYEHGEEAWRFLGSLLMPADEGKREEFEHSTYLPTNVHSRNCLTVSSLNGLKGSLIKPITMNTG